MIPEYREIGGSVINPQYLVLSKAKDIIKALQYLNYISLVECRKIDKNEAVIIDVDVQIPRDRINKINNIERIGIYFDNDETAIPKAYPLRKDFPIVPHCNFEESDMPISLCLDNRDKNEIIITWRASYFIEDIRRWLSETAVNKLHKEDQYLEPFWPITKDLLLVNDFIKEQDIFNIRLIDSGGSLNIYEATNCNYENIGNIAISFIVDDKIHGFINRVPKTLDNLNSILASQRFNLVGEMKKRLLEIKERIDILCSEIEKEIKAIQPSKYIFIKQPINYVRNIAAALNNKKANIENIYKTKIIISLIIPLKRQQGREIEYPAYYIFQTEQSLMQIGEILNIWTVNSGKPIIVIDGNIQRNCELNNITLKYFSPLFQYNRERALRNSGMEKYMQKMVAAIGLGAIGSQVYINLLRMGLYNWYLIDNDYMFPHNLSKHYLNQSHVGMPKVKALADIGNNILVNSTNYASKNALDYNVDELNKNDIILDLSATIHVPRYLSNNNSIVKRCISAFINPRGTDAVIIAEDCKRRIKLDELEMQYYRFIMGESDLSTHLQNNKPGIHYSTSCRDISSVMSQDYIALHSAIISNALPNIIEEDVPKIIIWRTYGGNINVNSYDVAIYKTKIIKNNEWTIKYDEGFIEKIYSFRERKLPAETGGVLLGSYDTLRKIIYVVDATPSPPDSEEWPKSYVRGHEDLEKEINRIRDVTLRNIDYIGEWHSHPIGSNSACSAIDKDALKIIAANLNPSSVPALMLIAGDKEDYGFYLS